MPGNRPFRRADLTNAEAFAAFDRLLDTTRTGSQYLKEPVIAVLVTEYLLRLAQQDDIYDLHAFAVMPNHVHMLFTPAMTLAQIMQRVKGGTARLANQLLGATGKTIWQDESYDHFVRDRDEFLRISRYIEFNPVRAGLVAMPEEFPYSSAAPGCRAFGRG